MSIFYKNISQELWPNSLSYLQRISLDVIHLSWLHHILPSTNMDSLSPLRFLHFLHFTSNSSLSSVASTGSWPLLCYRLSSLRQILLWINICGRERSRFGLGKSWSISHPSTNLPLLTRLSYWDQGEIWSVMQTLKPQAGRSWELEWLQCCSILYRKVVLEEVLGCA